MKNEEIIQSVIGIPSAMIYTTRIKAHELGLMLKKAREEERERIIIKKDVIHCDTCKRIVAFTCGSCGEGVRPLTRQGNHYQTSYEPKRITCMDCIEKLKSSERGNHIGHMSEAERTLIPSSKTDNALEVGSDNDAKEPVVIPAKRPKNCFDPECDGILEWLKGIEPQPYWRCPKCGQERVMWGKSKGEDNGTD